MEKWKRLKFGAVFCLIGIALFTLSACQPTAAVLPTSVPVAEIVMVAGTAVTPSPLAPTPLPGTFTPLSAGEGNEGIWAVRPLSTPLDPSITPTIPTRTPRPTRLPPATRTPFPTLTPIATITSQPPSVRPHYSNPYRGYTQSKLSIHVVQNNDAKIMEFVRNAQPRIMKSVGDLGFMNDVKSVSPFTITVGRVDDIFIQNYIGTPEEAAQAYVNKHLQTYRLNPGVDFWEGWNEPDPGLEWMSWYARFEQERVKLMAQNGLRSAIGGFPLGVPELDEFALFIPAIETTIQYGGILTLHEGDVDTGDIQYLYGSALPGYPYYADRGALAFRYRWFYRDYLEPMGLVIPLIVSELNFAGFNIVNEDDFINNQLPWYDAEAQKDEYVLGFAIFTAGPCCQWHKYDVTPLLPRLANYVNSQN